MSFQILYMHDICPDYKEFLKTLDFHAKVRNNIFSISSPQKIGNVFLVSIFKNFNDLEEKNKMVGLFFFNLSTFENKLYFFKNSYYQMMFFDDKNYIFYGCRYIVENNLLKIDVCEVNLYKHIEKIVIEVPITNLNSSEQLLNVSTKIDCIQK
ncbi:hypothetical protein [Caldicellulosiruptor acetigenus]|uniref:hypothetical protein n=1 Tax=Caldicellulosiruptor acetigenus TaxID=301953 RepID=UPI0001E99D86|nr:hypothetical protein [Caldicellulosiruptor acetigenus]